MTTADLYADDLPQLKPGDTVDFALDLMDDEQVSCLPLVSDGKFIGLVRETDLNAAQERGFDTAAEALWQGASPSVLADRPITNALEAMRQYNIYIVPVVDNENNYLGCIRAERIIHATAELLGSDVHGATIIVMLSTVDYSLTRIVNIIEENDAYILSLTTERNTASGIIGIHIKLNVDTAETVAAALERYGYEVITFSNPADDERDTLRRNYDSLMRYLSV